MKTPIPLSQFYCSNIGTFPSHLNTTFYNQNYRLLYLRFLMHFVLNCVCVFPRVFSVSQCIDFLLKDTIMYIFIDWEIKGTPFYSWTETGDYVRV